MLVKFIGVALMALAVLTATSHRVHAEEVTVFAAASLTSALNEIREKFLGKGGDTLRVSYAASSTLARQIENGAPAHVFVSADLEWMDYLEGKGLVDGASRLNLLGNMLVLIAPAGSRLTNLRLEVDNSIMDALGDGRMATGDPDHVPVGKYARQAFETLGQWKAVEGRLARMDSVRSALAMVERAEVPLGIVYATDAAVSSKVKVVATFPGALHAPVIYPVALVKGRESPAARAFIAFLQGNEAKGIFTKYGFKLN